MKLVFCVVAAVTIVNVHCGIYDSSLIEKIDFEAIRNNERLLQNHFDCLIEEKGCTPEADELRSTREYFFLLFHTVYSIR